MQDLQDYQLIQKYVDENSEAAFAILVERYLHFVYAIAVREAHNAALAEDITQVVFIILACKAHTLHKGTGLSGWLVNTTRFVAKNLLRHEARRQQREQEAVALNAADSQGARADQRAWDHLEPALYQALVDLRSGERDILRLRFFEGKSLKEVGQALAISEDTAQKRVTRALDKLRRHLAQQGYTLTAAIIGAMLAKNLARATPTLSVASVLHSLSGQSVSSAPAYRGSRIGRTGHKLMTSTYPGHAVASSYIHASAEGALRAMLISQIKVGVVASLGVSLAATSVGALALNTMTNTTIAPFSPARHPLVALPAANNGNAINSVVSLPQGTRRKTIVPLVSIKPGAQPQRYFPRSATTQRAVTRHPQSLPAISYVSFARPNGKASELMATHPELLETSAQVRYAPRIALVQDTIVSADDKAAYPPATPDARGKASDDDLAANITQAKQELERATGLYHAGVVSIQDVHQATLNLVSARLRFAMSHNQLEIAVQEAQKLVNAEEENVAIVNNQYKAGLAPVLDVNAAQIALTEARLRLQIYILINLQTENLKSVTALYNQGLVTHKEVAAATKAVADARSRLVDPAD